LIPTIVERATLPLHRIAFEMPYLLPSAANLREHWRRRAARVRSERATTAAAARAWDAPRVPFPLVVTITRVAPRMLDSDNSASAAKAVRDGIADALGVDDSNPLVLWRYSQEKGRPAVRVEIETDRMEESPVDGLQLGTRHLRREQGSQSRLAR
jgi:crossover junction endodeoxyribonuclease RusA